MTYVLFAAERNTKELPSYGPFVSTELKQGLYNGHGNPYVLLCYDDPLFYVAEVDDVDMYHTSMDGQCDFFRGTIVARGTLPHITYWLQTKGGDKWHHGPPFFGTASYAYGATKTALSGHYGVSIGAGIASSYTVCALDHGVAVSQAGGSTAITGYAGTSITGPRGLSISGKHGVSITGLLGHVMAGLRGTLISTYEVFGQLDQVSVHVDGDTILADRLYHLDLDAKFILASDIMQRKADVIARSNLQRRDI